jgi:predicted  nucleic acid-binding Zn-ribbon protein
MSWKCYECGRRYRTVTSARRAALYGCVRCGGVDIDLDVDGPRLFPPRKRPRLRPTEGKDRPGEGPPDRDPPDRAA